MRSAPSNPLSDPDSPSKWAPARLWLTALVILVLPFVWRLALLAGRSDVHPTPSYLPAFELARDRYPFEPEIRNELSRLKPDMVFLGDSMTLRVDPTRLEALTGERVFGAVRLATGSAHWFLMLKNYVAASEARPHRVAIFFRDTQLTDPLFRLAGKDRFSTDRFALDQEDELNSVIAAHLNNPWYRIHTWVDRLYGVERAREWLEPRALHALEGALSGSRGREPFVEAMNAEFGLDRLRAFSAADIGDTDAASLDFSSRVRISVLPDMLAVARAHQFRLLFVRVLRRPVNGQPPRESAALRRYVAALHAYLSAEGADFLDDRDVSALATLAYDDGDHILEEERPKYTDLLAARLARLPR